MKNLLLAIALVMFSLLAQANLIIVNSNQDAAIDDGLCTLREALAAANYDFAYFGCSAGLGDDLIWVLLGTSGDSIQLNSALPIFEGVEIQGPGADKLVLFPANSHDGSIFLINTTDDVKIQDMRIGGARSSAIDVVNVHDLIIEDMQFLNNTAASDNNYGGAIHADDNYGTTESINSLLVENTLFQSNSADFGGAIAAGGTHQVTVNNSDFKYNTGSSFGGAISRYTWNPIGWGEPIENIITSINNSQFIQNSSPNGAVALARQTLHINKSLFQNTLDAYTIFAPEIMGTIRNSIFANQSTGTAIYLKHHPYGSLRIVNVEFNTFINQSTAKDIYVAGDTAAASILGNAFAGSNPVSCQQANAGTLTSNGYNLEAAGSSCTINNNDIPNTDAELMPLSLYGGEILIAPPFPLSPLVDSGANCTNEDYSGEGRSRDGDGNGQARCDIGAVERPDAYNLNLDNVGNGSGQINLNVFDLVCHSPDECDWPLEQGETYTLTPVADSGSTFIQWGGACSGDTSCEVTMNTAKTVTAEFATVVNPIRLTTRKFANAPGLSATIVSAPAGIHCGRNCFADFVENDVVNLTAELGEDTVIDTWLGCDAISTNGVCKVVMGSSDRTVDLFLMQDPDIIFKDDFE
ncbi:MAG: hypothetical protein DWP95_07835 [Proteobacteria bacterium]|nr:MAG: hypothetical protein DWP95_07835 [Pseudomonadota bacterium]